MKVDYSLYLVTDGTFLSPRSLLESVRQAVLGGVSVVQLRQKQASQVEIREMGHALLKFLSPRGIPLIVNDYLDIAKEIGASGVHLGKNDCDIATARRELGPSAIIGLSVETVRDFEHSDFELCSYVAASPVFSTHTKMDSGEPMGLEGLRRLRSACPFPLIGIGGINQRNVEGLARAGVDGIAVASSILWTENPQEAARLLKTSFEKRRRREFE